jgi:hypothetical protein
MKYLDPTHATDVAQQPVKNGTLQFLQDSHKENLANVIISMIGATYSPNTVYALYGCNGVATSLNPYLVVQFQKGACFYNGEVFDFAEETLTFTGASSLLLTISTTQYMPASPLQADPVVFTDGTTHSVHNYRTMQIVFGPSGGSGVQGYVADFNSIVRPQLTLSVEADARAAADATLQAQIGTVPYGSNLQAEITALQNEVGTVPGGSNLQTEVTNVQNQVNAIGTGWQNIGLDSSNVAVAAGQGTGSINPAASGQLNYQVIGKTLMCSFNFTFGLQGSITGIAISALSGLTGFKYTGATCGIFFNSSVVQFPTSITWNSNSNTITVYPAGDQGGGGTSRFGDTTSNGGHGCICGTIIAQMQ